MIGLSLAFGEWCSLGLLSTFTINMFEKAMLLGPP